MLTDEDKRWMRNNLRKNDLFLVYVLLFIIGINSCESVKKVSLLTKDEDGLTVLGINDFCNFTNTVIQSVRKGYRD